MNKKDLGLYCKRRSFPVEWYKELEDILESNGFDNWHLREHALSDIITFIQEKVMIWVKFDDPGIYLNTPKFKS